MSTIDLELARLGLRPGATRARSTGAERWAALGAWATTRRISLVVGALVLAATATVHVWGMAQAPAAGDDEGTYLAQAWAVQERGELAHYTYWYDHPPLGWLQLAGWTWVTGAFARPFGALDGGRQLLAVAAVAVGGLLYLFGRRLGLSRPACAAAVLLWGLSPLAVGLSRQVLLDNLALPWILAAFVLAASPRSSLWAHAAAGACLAAAVLTKETALLVAPFVAWQLWVSADRRTRRFDLTALGAAFVLVAVAFPLFALLKGELLPSADRVSLVEAIRFQLVDRPGSGSVLEAGTTAHRIVADWFGADPWLLGAGLLVAPFGLFVRRLRPAAAALAFLGLVVLRPGYLPQGHVALVLPLAALVVAGVADAAWHRPPANAGRAVPATLRVVVLAGVVAAGAVVLPAWVEGDAALMTRDDRAPALAAERWIADNVDRDARLLVDDTLWVDLVEQGFDPDLGVVWFYKLDLATNLDPSVAERLPEGWRHFDYVVSSPIVRRGLEDLPGELGEVRLALERSVTVASFGSGNERVEVRRIQGGLA